MYLHPFVYMFLTLLLSVSVFHDCKHRKIPNLITLPFWFIAPAFYAYIGGMVSFIDSLYGLGAVFVITFPLFAIGWMGAGDVKLMSAVAALVSIKYALSVLLAILVSGLLLSIVVLAKQGLLLSTLQRYGAIIGLSKLMKKATYIEPSNAEKEIILPYAIPISLGTVAALMFLSWE